LALFDLGYIVRICDFEILFDWWANYGYVYICYLL